ncbi:MAG: tetratricopeptide repeat protein [Nitrospinae bacterium]|nr:tetratricopeptide repeat protein [Nitrospinota bacterium]
MEETLAAYEKARELDPGNPVVSNRYARYLVSQYRYEEAEKILKDAEKKSPEDVGVLVNLASLLVYLNKEQDLAFRLIERGSRIDPGRAAWYRLSGVIRKRRELGIAPKAKGVN